jgi:large subunit ribosomal protein L3
MPGIIGKKVGMTQVYDDTGRVVAVTVIHAGPCVVLQKKTKEKDGYEALQLAWGEKKEKRTPQANLARFRKAGATPKRFLREFEADMPVEPGAEVTVSVFEPGILVDVIGTTMGRGFAGTTKRHKFHGGDDTHGCTTHRLPGSIGASAYPSRVIKGKRLPGHMGDARLTAKNLRVVAVDPEENLLLVKGAVPGKPNGMVMVRTAKSTLGLGGRKK